MEAHSIAIPKGLKTVLIDLNDVVAFEYFCPMRETFFLKEHYLLHLIGGYKIKVTLKEQISEVEDYIKDKFPRVEDITQEMGQEKSLLIHPFKVYDINENAIDLHNIQEIEVFGSQEEGISHVKVRFISEGTEMRATITDKRNINNVISFFGYDKDMLVVNDSLKLNKLEYDSNSLSPEDEIKVDKILENLSVKDDDGESLKIKNMVNITYASMDNYYHIYYKDGDHSIIKRVSEPKEVGTLWGLLDRGMLSKERHLREHNPSFKVEIDRRAVLQYAIDRENIASLIE